MKRGLENIIKGLFSNKAKTFIFNGTGAVASVEKYVSFM